MLGLAIPDLMALVSGESIIAFVPRSTVEQGDEVDLTPTGSRPPAELRPGYHHWALRNAPAGSWTAVVEEVHPVAALDPAAGASRHVLAEVPDGDLVVLRVYGTDGPALSDVAYAARRHSLGTALAP